MENMISLIEKTSLKWFSVMANSSLQLTVFLGIIAGLSLLFRHKSATFLYWLWLIGSLKALIPPAINLDFLFPQRELQIPVILPVFQLPEVTVDVAPVATSSIELSFHSYLFLGWAIAVIIFMGKWLYQNIRLSRKITGSAKPFVLPVQLKHLLSDFSRVKIFILPQCSSPFVRGVISPKIFLPEQAKNWSSSELRAVLLHELAHIQRRDLIFIGVQNFIQIVFFFHPFVWFANVQIFRYREKACDDAAVQKMGGDAVAYSRYLLNFLHNTMVPQPIFPVSNHFLQKRKYLINRFEYLLTKKEMIMRKITTMQKQILIGCIALGLGLTLVQSQVPPKNLAPVDGFGSAVTAGDDQKKKGDNTLSPQQFKKQKELNDTQFVPYDEPPEPIGGFAAIQMNLLYPEAARKAGIEGTVIIYTQIDTNGQVVNTRIIKSIDDTSGCEEAAIEALKSVKWIPAKQGKTPVTVWVSV
ncbi:MAG TPA: M56 family peptidase, partial [bacterium]|nr:M56 family peptidase [bacterium]